MALVLILATGLGRGLGLGVTATGGLTGTAATGGAIRLPFSMANSCQRAAPRSREYSSSANVSALPGAIPSASSDDALPCRSHPARRRRRLTTLLRTSGERPRRNIICLYDFGATFRRCYRTGGGLAIM